MPCAMSIIADLVLPCLAAHSLPSISTHSLHNHTTQEQGRHLKAHCCRTASIQTLRQAALAPCRQKPGESAPLVAGCNRASEDFVASIREHAVVASSCCCNVLQKTSLTLFLYTSCRNSRHDRCKCRNASTLVSPFPIQPSRRERWHSYCNNNY